MTKTSVDSIAALTICRFFYISGCDGTGKSTQATQLLSRLNEIGIKTHHLWLRFPFLFSLPLLAYARWRGYSWYEEADSIRHGYWDFRYSWVLHTVLPWLLLIDATLAAIGKLYLPLLLGKTVVCERFVYDMLVDLAVAVGHDLHQKLPGKLYLHLLPKSAHVVVLDLNAETIRERRTDLQLDQRLDTRLQAYRRLATDLSLLVVSSQLPIAEVSHIIWQSRKW